MRSMTLAAAVLAALALPAAAQEKAPLVFWGFQGEQFEYRASADDDVLAWDFDAFVGTDDLRFLWRSEAEYLPGPDAFEALENQARLETPVSTFFNVAAGVRLDTPEGEERAYGVVGLHGLAPQWFEVDADLFVSEDGDPSLRFDAEYEGLITNRLILRPALEVNLPFTDDEEAGVGAGAPTIEVGLRLSYDLIDRTLAPYVGIHYERAFGETADLIRDEGEDAGQLFGVVGVRLLF